MELKAFVSPVEFQALVLSFLQREEALNCVFLSVLDALVRDPKRFPRHYLSAILDGDKVVGASWMTPPFALGLTRMPASGLPLLLTHAATFPERVPGLIGPKPTVDEFHALWTATRGSRLRQKMDQRFYQLERIAREASVKGELRQATLADLDRLESWTRGFAEDAHLSHEMPDPRTFAESAIKSGRRYLWEHASRPVAMADYSGQTPSGVRLGWVYTPPDERGHGYASALVTALCRKQLAEGKRFCFLGTDLANPTSNRIYQRIGFQPVGDFTYYMFQE